MLFLLFVCMVGFFFFFKQKTAYEMRISDWSSDVCSSDLLGVCSGLCELWVSPWVGRRQFVTRITDQPFARGRACIRRDARARMLVAERSEEHTSELQSLMRISYAVFCLKKKKYIKQRDIKRPNNNTNTLNHINKIT